MHRAGGLSCHVHDKMWAPVWPIGAELLRTDLAVGNRPSMRIKRWTVSAFLLSLVVALLAVGPSSSADEGPQPGFPAYPPMDLPDWLPGNPFSGVLQVGIAEMAKQRQRARTGPVIATNIIQYSPTGQAGTSDCDPSDPNVRSCFATRNNLVLLSPPGSDHNYGLSPEFTVRTLAFGSIPVEVRAQLEQQRDRRGIPEYISVITPDKNVNAGPTNGSRERFTYDTEVDAALFVRIKGLSVDGRPIRLSNRCGTAAPALLRLDGEGFWGDDPAVTDPLWESEVFAAGKGGLLTGTISVGRFANCGTADGDDLAPLLTAAVSGPENAVRLHVTGPTCGGPMGSDSDSPFPPGGTFEQWRDAGCLVPPDPAFADLENQGSGS